MRTLHHIGIPTPTPRPGESYVEALKLHITDASQSPNKIEWLRFEPDCEMPDMLKTLPHIGYVVEDLEAELEGAEILLEPFQPMEGVTVAFVVEEGAPIEFLKFD